MIANKALHWRYATKRMTEQVVPDNIIDKIIETIHLSPSGMGLQPYEVFLISNKEIKSKIQSIAYNQKQAIECSHLLVFAAWDKYTHNRIDNVFDYLAQERNIPLSETEGQRNSAKNYFHSQLGDENFHHAAKQAKPSTHPDLNYQQEYATWGSKTTAKVRCIHLRRCSNAAMK